MLEKTHTPAALLLGALAGVLAATLCILGSAAWMAKQGCSASMAWPLATVSVCVGGFCGSALAAFWKKEQGLLTGLLLGGLFAAALSGLLLMSGGSTYSKRYKNSFSNLLNNAFHYSSSFMSSRNI